ncbi:dTDP-glucose 4,6-dehydratase [Candidatus Kaiserbacteria bacterium]|nr:dTDP-glucose 4,6-dehydratase [Candidatus Kaiserbacteria bacterium]
MTYTKTLLVTGGAGFIGSNYLNLTVPRYPQYRFVNVDLLTYAADLKNLGVEDAENYSFEKADIRDHAAIEKIFNTYAPTDLIHFAAESHVDNSIESPRVFVETNVLGTEILLELAREYGLKRFHYISTDEVYGTLALDSRSSVESDALAPNSPYSASKAAGEMLVRAYHETYGMDTLVTRGSNNFGPHQHKEKFMPLFIANFLSGKKVPLYGTGKNTRNWIYVSDHVEGIDTAFHKGKSGEIYNIGGATELENSVVARMLAKEIGALEDLIELVKDRPGHDLRYSLDSSKAEKEFGWKPKISFEQGLKKTIKYYKEKLGR